MNSNNNDALEVRKGNPKGDFENNLPNTTIHRMNQELVALIVNKDESKLKMNQIDNTDEKLHNPPIIDIRKVCHVCFCYSKDFISLVKSNDCALANMYSYITSLEVLSFESIALQICETCQNDVIFCYKFKLKCEKSFYSLLQSSECVKDADKEPRFLQKKCFETQTNQDESDGSFIKVNESIAKVSNFQEEHDIPEENVEYLENEYFEVSSNDKDDVDINNKLAEISVADKEQLTIYKEKKNSKDLDFYCTICQKKFLKETSLKAHLKSHKTKNENLYNCSKCKETFSSEHDLNIHSALHTKGNKWTCNKCFKDFNDRSRLRRHIWRHFERKPYSCEWCSKQFAELCALRRHVCVHTGQRGEKTHLCPLCDKRYMHAGQLRAHMSSHTGSRPCACDTCGKRFPSRRLLASHRLVHSDLKPHACTFCDKRFRHESTRNTHHRTHTGEKPYVCSICGKTFIQNSNLTLHMRTHTGEKPYSCETCGRMFKSGSSLNNHMRTHSGEKPYECTVCGKKFARASMAGHMRLHTGELAHTCCACRKTFATASRLRAHARVHTGEKPYKCTLCPIQYRKESCLTKHIKKHEKDSKTENVVYVHKMPVIITDKYILTKEDEPDEVKGDVLLTEDGPIEVSQELILQEDVKTELLVIDDGQNITYQSSKVIANDYDSNNDINNINILSVNEELDATELLEGTTVKFYRLDQNLVQIHTSGDQVTISKISNEK